MTERRADEASREVEQWLKCWYMRDRVGEEFDGRINSVTAFGIFVGLDELHVEGLVHVSELGTDYFRFEAAKHEMVGERTGRRFRLADRVRVRIARVDLETSRIEFMLAHDRQGRRSPLSLHGNRQADAHEGRQQPSAPQQVVPGQEPVRFEGRCA